MRYWVFSLALVVSTTTTALGQTAPLKPALSDVRFLVGSWGSGNGTVAETGGTSRGSSTIGVEAGGSVLLRRDHTQLFNKDGNPTGSFDQIMMIYPEGGTLHADYSDGDHIIHYTSAVVVPDRSVVFSSAASPTAPAFRLTYEKSSPDTLAITFEMAPPGQAAFHPIAAGTLHKTGP